MRACCQTKFGSKNEAIYMYSHLNNFIATYQPADKRIQNVFELQNVLKSLLFCV